MTGEATLRLREQQLHQARLRACAVECKLDATSIALREAELIVPTLLAREQYLSKKSRKTTSNGADDAKNDSPQDLSRDTCHLCGRSDANELMVCSNESAGPVNANGAKKAKGKRGKKVDESVDQNPGGGSNSDRVCRNVICRTCFVKEGWDWEAACNDDSWECCHCKGACPSKALCKLKALRILAASRIKESYDEEPEEEAADDNEEECAICKEHGDLMCCDGCPAVFHLKCLKLEAIPDTEWFCDTCKEIQEKIKDNPEWRSQPVVLSLFDGIGAAYVALRRLGVKPSIYLSSEIDEVACDVLDTYAASHGGNVVQVGDVRAFHADRDLPRLLKSVEDEEVVRHKLADGEPVVDLMIGGSPCTDLSFLGQGAGVVQGSQSSFFFEYVRILREVKPRWFVFENVRMKKEDQDIISKELGVQPTPVDSVDLSPCRRNRLFWTNIPIRKIPSNLTDRPMLAQDIVLDDAFPELSKANCITRGNSSPHLGDSRFNVLWYPDGKRRSYHPVELERLMGFPDFYTEVETSRTQRQGMIGNSFSVYSVAHILGSLFRGDIRAPELEWKGTKALNSAVIVQERVRMPQARTLSEEEGPIELPPLPEVPPRLSIGEREKARRALRRLQKATDNLAVDEVPGTTDMPGKQPPNFIKRFAVLVNEAPANAPSSWSTAILVPRPDYDNTMPNNPPPSRGSKPCHVVRYFANGAYGLITGDENVRVIASSDPEAEPVATMNRCLPGWISRKDTIKALAYAGGGRPPANMKWSKWTDNEHVLNMLQNPGATTAPSRTSRRRTNGVDTGCDVSSMPGSPMLTNVIPCETNKDAQKTDAGTPSLASISARLDLSVPELPSVHVDGKTAAVGSIVPEGGYSKFEDVEADFRAALGAIAKANPDLEAGIMNAFEKEWANDEEIWLKEGGLVFVVPGKFLGGKKGTTANNQIWWPGMIIPLEELDSSIPLRATGPSSYVVRYFEDNSCSVVSSKAMAPFDHDVPGGNFHKLIERFGEQAVRSHASIRKALRYVTTGGVPPGFPWALWGSSGLYRTGAAPSKRKRATEGSADDESSKRLRVDGEALVFEEAEDGSIRRCKECHTTETTCWRNGTTGPKTLCNNCGLKLYLATVPRVPVSDLSNDRFTENLDKSKNNSEHRYYTTRRPLPFPIWDKLGGGMLDSNFKLKEGFTLPPDEDSTDAVDTVPPATLRCEADVGPSVVEDEMDVSVEGVATAADRTGSPVTATA